MVAAGPGEAQPRPCSSVLEDNMLSLPTPLPLFWCPAPGIPLLVYLHFSAASGNRPTVKALGGVLDSQPLVTLDPTSHLAKSPACSP